MVTVAKSFDAPIKLIFPQDLIEQGLFAANKFAMLGLGKEGEGDFSSLLSLCISLR